MYRIDTQALKEQISCRHVIELEWGPPSYGHNWQCPFHNEQHGYAFGATHKRWRCFGKCNTSGDVIAFVMRTRNLRFQEACEYLQCLQHGVVLGNTPLLGNAYNKPQPQMTTLGHDWSVQIERIVDRAQKLLWAAPNAGMDYLISRGLNEETIKFGNLGYIPYGDYGWHQFKGISVPSGVIFPSYTKGILQQVRIRRLPQWLATHKNPNAPRYLSIKGGKMQGSLFLGDSLQPATPIIIDEGEINALTIHQMAKEIKLNVSVAALTSASNTITSQWYSKLVMSQRIFMRLDNDDAGQGCFNRHIEKKLPIESANYRFDQDVNDLYRTNKDQAYRWLEHTIRVAEGKLL